MATTIKNEKGFKVIQCSMTEMANLGGLGICDYCNKAAFTGYYIAVLNSWYCEECYLAWVKRAKYYEEDRYVETRNFNAYAKLLNVSE